MKVISVSTDKKIFENDSAVRQRQIEYGELFDELHIVVFSKFGSNSKIQISQNVWAYPTNSKSRLFYIWDAFKIGRAIISKLGASNVVLSTQDPFETGIVGLILKILYKLPLQIQVHTDFANRYFILHSLLNFIRFPIGLFTLSFADSVRVVSERIAESIQSLSHHVSVLPIMTSPISVPLLRSNEERERSKGVSILTVARLEKEKDLETAIRAFKKVLESGTEAEFVIVGDGSEKKNLQLLTKSLGLENKIKFVGWQINLSEFYAKAHIYISTSLYEGYGMSIVEAAIWGKALVISDAGVAGSLFKDGEEALVVTPRDIDGFARALVNLTTDPILRDKLAHKAHIAAEAHVGESVGYLAKYKEAMGQALIVNKSPGGIFKKNILARYLVAGLTGAFTQIGLLYVFTDVVGIWYLYSSLMAFVVALVVSFTLQKMWTFGDRQMDGAHKQFGKYFIVALIGIVINTSLMFVLVDMLGLWYILAQIIVGGVIAVCNFLMYKFFVFKK